MHKVIQDFRYALRRLRKSPGFAAVAVITLAVGIGANTAMFSVMHAVLLKPLAIKDPSRVMFVQERMRDNEGGLSVGNFSDMRRQSSTFDSLGASANAGFNLTAIREEPERVGGEIVTASYFTTLGVQPVAGRVFTGEEDQPGNSQVVVLSERRWQKQFHAEKSAIGRTLHINGQPYTILGVMPRTFDPLLQDSELWVPAAFTAQQIANHDLHYLSVVGRLKPGVSLAAAQSELHLISQRLAQQFPMDDKEVSLRAIPLTTALLGDQKLTMGLLLAAVGFLLLIACANIANLQLSRSQARKKEMAVRAALGASAGRIVTQLLVESVVLATASGALGILLAYGGVAWIVAKGPSEVPRLNQSSVNATALVFTAAVTLLASFLFGLAPALRSASPRLVDAIKAGAGTSSGSRDRVQSILVVGEIALALMLMAGAGLLIRSALAVLREDPGFEASNLIVGHVALPDAGYHDPTLARQTFEHIVEAGAALPGVQSAAVVSRAPLAGGWSGNGLIAEGRPIDPTSRVMAISQFVSPGYLGTARIPLKTGRDFTPQDTRDKPKITLINETLARTMWPGQNPIGKRFACCEDGPGGRTDPVWHEVVGVVGDVRAQSLDRDIPPEFYLPIAQMPPGAWDWLGRTMDVVVRTRGNAFPVNELRSTVASIAPGVPIDQLSTMQQKIGESLAESHFDTFLLSTFAGIALLLSSVGTYGVLSHFFGQRTRDLGLRMALGATQTQIAREVLVWGLRLITAGIILGVAAALACAHLLSSMLYGVRSTDTLAFVLASVVLASVALFACCMPARRAMKVDPMVALRYE